MNCHMILVEQCETSWTLRERFGVKSALDYLVGEKLLNFRIFNVVGKFPISAFNQACRRNERICRSASLDCDLSARVPHARNHSVCRGPTYWLGASFWQTLTFSYL